ncbi:MAG TPA: hypothetical protein DDW31_08550 [candidate division Zixibacteria bacterium]|jgi:hypothetical protein|nr:hypothetical protein [candidate division Zixibacteria bacterium]
MIEHLHDHAVSELQQSARTDTVFVVTAVCFNLVVLAINWILAASDRTGARILIFMLLIAATLLINAFAVQALRNGRRTRLLLLSGLAQMYRDNGVDKYYDPELLRTYGARYGLFTAVIISLAAMAIAVPMIQWLSGG